MIALICIQEPLKDRLLPQPSTKDVKNSQNTILPSSNTCVFVACAFVEMFSFLFPSVRGQPVLLHKHYTSSESKSLLARKYYAM